MTVDTRETADRDQMHSPFGTDVFGRRAEAFARTFGTPNFIIGQTVIVGAWIVMNVIARTWDPYPFILLNLAFSLQAAYAAPLILLAQTRQADRDRVLSEADMEHREALAADSTARQEAALHLSGQLRELLEENTRLTEEIKHLTSEIHRGVLPDGT